MDAIMRALVLNHERFAREVLGRWFKHQKFTSFVRQLNMYGFHKIPHLQQGVLKSDSDTEPWNFEHPHFHRGQPDLLCLIQRKKQPANSNTEDGDVQDNTSATAAHAAATTPGQLLDVNSLVNGIAAIKRHQQAISADLQALKKSNEMLWEEATLARQRHDKHQDTINRILKFLAGVFGHSTDSLDQHDDPGHSPSVAPPRARQRLMIGDGRAGKGSKTVEVTDVVDEDEDDLLQSVHPHESATLPLAGKFPYDLLQQLVYEVQQRIGQVSSVTSPLMSPAPSTAPSEIFSPTTTPTGFDGRPTRPTEVLSRTNTNTSNHGPTTDASTHSTPTLRHADPEPTVSPSTLSTFSPSATSNVPESAWSSAIQQVLTNPQQMQRLMQALAAQPNFPTAPPPDTGYMPPQPTAQLMPYAPYDYNRFRHDLPVATQIPPSTLPMLGPSIPAHDDGPSFDPLLENASHLEKTYRNAGDIEADMDVLQSSLNSFIRDLGMDPPSLSQQERDMQGRQGGGPYLDSIGDMHPPADGVQPAGIRANGPNNAPMLNGYHSDPSSDLFLESLLNGMGTGGDSNVDYTDITDRYDPSTRIDGINVGDASTDQLTAFLDEVSDTASPNPIIDSSTVTPQKRNSDAAGLSLPSSSPSNVIDHALAGPKTKRKR